MKIKNVPLHEIKPYENNVKQHPVAQLEILVKSIQRYGFRGTILLDKDNVIVAGHARYEAASVAGLTELPCEYADDLTSEQIIEYRILDNKIAEMGYDDEKKFLEEAAKIPDFDFSEFGVELPEPTTEIKEGLTDDDETPELKIECTTKSGDIWILGDHRLMCGDSTMIDQIESLMNGYKADMAFTSPPYNLGDNSKLRGSNASGKDSAYLDKSDHKTNLEYLDFLVSFTNNVLTVADTLFVNIQLLAGNKLIVPEYWKLNASRLIDVIVWDKENAQPAMAENVLNSVWEFIFIFCNEENPKRSMKHGLDFRGTKENIYRLNPNGKKDPLAKDHGAVFPVQFAEHFIESFSDKLVLEPFAGSGTTMIACEKLGRSSFNMELDPRYCDVIIKRWQNFTGDDAIHEESGKKFNEMSPLV